MLILSNIECDARSSHYFSFFFQFRFEAIYCFLFLSINALYDFITSLNDVETIDRLSKELQKQ